MVLKRTSQPKAKEISISFLVTSWSQDITVLLMLVLGVIHRVSTFFSQKGLPFVYARADLLWTRWTFREVAEWSQGGTESALWVLGSARRFPSRRSLRDEILENGRRDETLASIVIPTSWKSVDTGSILWRFHRSLTSKYVEGLHTLLNICWKRWLAGLESSGLLTAFTGLQLWSCSAQQPVECMTIQRHESLLSGCPKHDAPKCWATVPFVGQKGFSRCFCRQSVSWGIFDSRYASALLSWGILPKVDHHNLQWKCRTAPSDNSLYWTFDWTHKQLHSMESWPNHIVGIVYSLVCNTTVYIHILSNTYI